LTEIDASARLPGIELELLRSVPIFGPLPEPTLERLSWQLVRVAVPAATAVIRQGDRGDRFYVIAEGELDVVSDGRTVAVLRSGGSRVVVVLGGCGARIRTLTTRSRAERPTIRRPRNGSGKSYVSSR